MPKASTKTSGSKAANNRIEPYSKSSPKIKDKENVDPKTQDSTKPDHDRGDYRDISLDEIKGEVPCYDDAATVRRKLKKLLTDKSIIPGTSKKWTQAAMVAEMQELEKRGHPVPYNQNATGPSARSLGNFLKKTGKMGAGDSPCYYWGYILSEKLRIWNVRLFRGVVFHFFRGRWMFETCLESSFPRHVCLPEDGNADTELANRVTRRASRGSRLRKSKSARLFLCGLISCRGWSLSLRFPLVDFQADMSARTLRPSACRCQEVVLLRLEPGSPMRVALLLLCHPCLLDLRAFVQVPLCHSCLVDLRFVQASFHLCQTLR